MPDTPDTREGRTCWYCRHHGCDESCVPVTSLADQLTRWRKVACDLAWAQNGQPHTAAEEQALLAYDRLVAEERPASLGTTP